MLNMDLINPNKNNWLKIVIKKRLIKSWTEKWGEIALDFFGSVPHGCLLVECLLLIWHKGVFHSNTKDIYPQPFHTIHFFCQHINYIHVPLSLIFLSLIIMSLLSEYIISLSYVIPKMIQYLLRVYDKFKCVCIKT